MGKNYQPQLVQDFFYQQYVVFSEFSDYSSSQISKAEVGILMARGLLAAVVESVLLDNTVTKTLWFVERKENVKQRHIQYYI